MMPFRRLAQLAFVVLVPLAAFSFDSAKWLAKRDRMSEEAKLLKAAYSNVVKCVTSPSEDLTIPLETNPDGSVRVLVFAKRAQFFNDSTLIWAEDMKVTKFDTEGVEKSRIEASKCIVDRVSRSGWAEGGARLVQGKTVFGGDGVYFSSSNGFVTIYSKSDLQSEDLKFGGLR